MINFVTKSRKDLRRIIDQTKNPYAVPRVNKVMDSAAYATINMNTNPAYGTQNDAVIKMNTDSAYAVTNILAIKA